MAVNPLHVRDPDDETEPTVRHVNAERNKVDTEVSIAEPPLTIEDDDAKSMRSMCSSEATTTFPPPLIDEQDSYRRPFDADQICSVQSRKRLRPPLSDASSESDGEREKIVDVDDDADRQRWKHRLQAVNEAGLFEIPDNISEVPLATLRRLYNTNRKCVQIDSLVKFYSAALLISFVAVDVVSENLIGVDMDKYVEMQQQQMHVYRYHLRRIAEKQVTSARYNGIFGENQSPTMSIVLTFSLTTVCFFAVRLFARNYSKLSQVMAWMTRIFATPHQNHSDAEAPTFNPITTFIGMLTPQHPSGSSRMPLPHEM